MVEVGRNDFCPCGSGKKYKKCCGSKTRTPCHSYSQICKTKSKATIQKVTSMVSQTMRKIKPKASNEKGKKFLNHSDVSSLQKNKEESSS